MSARPEAVGLSSTRLERIDQFVQRKYIDTGKFPCASALVWRRGEIAHISLEGDLATIPPAHTKNNTTGPLG